MNKPCALCGAIGVITPALAEQIVDSGDVQPGLCHLGTKFSVRDREQLLRYVEQGYRIYLDQTAGVKFLCCEGKPDIIYDL